MSRFLLFRFARRPPVSTGVFLPDRLLPPDSDGSLTSMAKGINDVLNYYIQVTDTKASVFLAGSIASASYLLMDYPGAWWARAIYFGAASCLAVALILSTLVILPRIPAGTGNGSVFWGDISSCDSPAEYRDRFGKTAKAGLLDEEYCVLNYHTSHILRRKIKLLRSSILWFLTGVFAAVPHHIFHS